MFEKISQKLQFADDVVTRPFQRLFSFLESCGANAAHILSWVSAMVVGVATIYLAMALTYPGHGLAAKVYYSILATMVCFVLMRKFSMHRSMAQVSWTPSVEAIYILAAERNRVWAMPYRLLLIGFTVYAVFIDPSSWKDTFNVMSLALLLAFIVEMYMNRCSPDFSGNQRIKNPVAREASGGVL